MARMDEEALIIPDIEYDPKGEPSTKTSSPKCSGARIARSTTAVVSLCLLLASATIGIGKTASGGSKLPATKDLAGGMMSMDALSLFDNYDKVKEDTAHLTSQCKAYIAEHNAEDVQYRRSEMKDCSLVEALNCTNSYVGLPKVLEQSGKDELGSWQCIPLSCQPEDPGPIEQFFEAGIKKHSGLEVDVQIHCHVHKHFGAY